MENRNSIKITLNTRKAIKEMIKSAINYENVTGRRPGITGEVGEILVCDKLRLFLVRKQTNTGFDAIDNNGKKYQIKTMRIIGNEVRGRIGIFSSKHKFNFAILVLLDEKYNIKEIWKMNYKTLSKIIKRHENPPARIFIDSAKKI